MERREVFTRLAGAGLVLGAAGSQTAGAQEVILTKPVRPLTPPQPPEPPKENPNDGKYPLSRVVAEISERSGVLVVADSSVADDRAALPAKDADIRPANVDRFIADAIKDLEAGVVWAKFNLPPAPKGKKWTGDDVSAYATGLMRLYGTVGGSGTEGTVEVIGQSVQLEQATPIFQILNLQPVYLVTRRTGRATFHGKWEATYGVLSLTAERSGRVTGYYVTNKGSITGRIVRDTLEFRWFEAQVNQGGSGRFFLAEDGDSFTGVWWNDGEDLSAPGRSWTGKRLSYKP